MFQSTRPRRARHTTAMALKSVTNVSIHAPTQGATNEDLGIVITVLGFNPRAHAGRDQPFPDNAIISPGFNPRAHAGRDAELCDMGGMSVVSIHAPTQGATPLKLYTLYGPPFQSTRPRRARPSFDRS